MSTRVTLIGHYPPPYGGVATLMAQMESALGAAGIPVTVWNLGHGTPAGENVVDFDDANRAHEVWQLWRALAGSEADVFHVLSSSYRSFWMASVCLVLAGFTRRKMVVSFVGGAFAEFVGSLRGAKRSFARFALSKASVLLPCNEEIERAVGMLAPGTPMRRISNTFPFDAGAAGPLPEDVERFVGSRTPVVSTTGAASEEYDLVGAVRGIAGLRERHPDVGFVVVMTRYGNSAYEEELERVIEEEGLSGHVLVARDIPSFVALLARSDAFLRSTLVDGDSMSVREALSLGLPTVASDTPFRPEGVILYRKGEVPDMIVKLEGALAGGRADGADAREEADANLEALVGIYDDVARRN
jgi:glycosyltransferase involved in cell wall biosynthesis